jgi:hypothetical protein
VRHARSPALALAGVIVSPMSFSMIDSRTAQVLVT